MGEHFNGYMFCFVFSNFIYFYVSIVCLFFFIMLEVGNLQASIKGYFSYFLIMKELTGFFKMKNKMDRSISY